MRICPYKTSTNAGREAQSEVEVKTRCAASFTFHLPKTVESSLVFECRDLRNHRIQHGIIRRTHLQRASPQSDTGLRRYADSPDFVPDAYVNESDNPESI